MRERERIAAACAGVRASDKRWQRIAISLSVSPPSPEDEYEPTVVCEVERHCRELFLRRHGVGLALPCTVLGQRRGELLEKLVRQGVFGGLGRDDAVGRDDVGVVGQLLGH